MDADSSNDAGPAGSGGPLPPTVTGTPGRMLLLSALATLLAQAPVTAAESAPPTPPPAPLVAPEGATPRSPLPAPLSSAEAVEPSGARVELAPGTEAIVDPASSFRVVLPGRSDDARLSLLDAADALVPATGTREVGERTVLVVTPRQPLVPASRYLLRLDGARERDLHDAAGRAAGPVELHLVAAGSPPEKPKKGVRKKQPRR